MGMLPSPNPHFYAYDGVTNTRNMSDVIGMRMTMYEAMRE